MTVACRPFLLNNPTKGIISKKQPPHWSKSRNLFYKETVQTQVTESQELGSGKKTETASHSSGGPWKKMYVPCLWGSLPRETNGDVDQTNGASGAVCRPSVVQSHSSEPSMSMLLRRRVRPIDPGAEGDIWPWVKIQIVAPVNIPLQPRK